MISKFLTEMSWSKESFSTISAFARAASSLKPSRSSVSSASTGVMRRDSPYQSRGGLAHGLELVVAPGVFLVALPGVEELGFDLGGQGGAVEVSAGRPSREKEECEGEEEGDDFHRSGYCMS